MPTHPTVQYLAIPGYDGRYRIGDDGSVWSRYDYTTKKYDGDWWQMKSPPTNYGYPTVVLRQPNGRVKQLLVGHIVLTVFVGPRPPGLVMLHEDDNPANNRVDNLSWGTQTKNMKDAVKRGRINRVGICTKGGKLAPYVSQVRRLRANGWSHSRLAAKFHVSITAIADLLNGKNYKRI